MNEKTAAVPIVSVIIPTYNRFDFLLQTLDALSSQTLEKNCFEVIVVDDGSTDATREVAAKSYPFKLIYVVQDNQGSAAARNHGASVSTGRVLVFIDDDITLSPAYLQAVLEAIANGQKTVCMGVFLPYRTEDSSVFAKLHPCVFPAAYPDLSTDRETAFVDCSSNNLIIERHLFEEVGMWKDVLGDGPTLWGDVEFGYRALQKGCRFVCVAYARLVHRDQHISDLAAAARRAHHVSRIVQPLFALHPEIRLRLPMFYDKSPIVWKKDSPLLIFRKLARQIASSQPVMWVMERLVPFFERYMPTSKPLVLCYRWIISGYIYRGYREGLREYVRQSHCIAGGGF